MIKELLVYNYIDDIYTYNDNPFDIQMKPNFLFGGFSENSKSYIHQDLPSINKYTIGNNVNDNVVHSCNNMNNSNCEYCKTFHNYNVCLCRANCYFCQKPRVSCIARTILGYILDNSNKSNYLLFKINYSLNFLSLNQEYIHKIYFIYKTLLCHKNKLAGAILESGNRTDHCYSSNLKFKDIDWKAHIVLSDFYRYKVKLFGEKLEIQTHFATYILESLDYRYFLLSYDFIAMHAYVKNISYHDSVNEIYNHINATEYLKTDDNDKVKWMTQESNPISETCHIFSPFLEYLNNKKINYSQYFYRNIDNNIIGFVVCYQNDYSEHIKIYHFFCRHGSGQNTTFIPAFPIEPYMIYNIEEAKNFNTVMFCDSEEEVESYRISDSQIPYISCPGGIENMSHADFSNLKNKCINIKFNINHCINKLDEEDFNRLYKIECENHINFIFETIHSGVNNENKNLIEMREFLGFSCQNNISTVEDNGWIESGSELLYEPNEYNFIIDDFISRGRITWIFAPEKSFKTYFALFLAYSLSKGNTNFGPFTTKSPCKVAYLNGEMYDQDINYRILSIKKGYGDNSNEADFRIFNLIGNNSLYSCESCEEYYKNNICKDNLFCSTIACPKWINKNKQQLYSSDVVIFDNYSSLFVNDTKIKKIKNIFEDLKSSNIAVVVIDHANSLSELQGDTNKKRYLDYCISLKYEQETCTLDIKLEISRHCPTKNFPTSRVIFDNSTVRLVCEHIEDIPINECKTEINTVSTKSLTNNIFINQLKGISERDKKYVFCYLAKYHYNIQFEDINIDLKESTFNAYASTLNMALKSVNNQTNTSETRKINVLLCKSCCDEISKKVNDKEKFVQIFGYSLV